MTEAAGPGRPLRARDRAAPGRVYRNPTTSLLYTHALVRGRRTARRGRAAGRRHRPVHRPLAQGQVPRRRGRLARPDLVGRRQPAAVSEEHFDGLREKVTARLAAADALYVVDAWAGADTAHRIGVRVDHGAPVPRAVREDDVHRARPGRGGEPSSRRRSSCTRPTSKRCRRTMGRAPARSSSCIRAAPSCSSAARSTRARSRSRSSP